MKKDKLFELLQDYVYDLDHGDRDQELKQQLIAAGINVGELWKSADCFLEKIAEKYGVD